MKRGREGEEEERKNKARLSVDAGTGPPGTPARTPGKEAGQQTEASGKVPVKRLHMPAATFNVTKFVEAKHRHASLHELMDYDVGVLEGLEKVDKTLQAYGICSVQDLATWQPWLLARALVTASEGEGETRPSASKMNIHRAVEARYESKSLREIITLPLSSLVCLGSRANQDFARLGINCIADLGRWKQAHWAESLSVLSAYENIITRRR